jgi:uncharacterized protein (DUF427 family)
MKPDPARSHETSLMASRRYHSIPTGGSRSEYAVWTYEKPYEAVASIKEHLAFYPSRVDAIEVIS